LGSLRNETKLGEIGPGNNEGNQKQVKVVKRTHFAMLPLVFLLNCSQANILISRVLAHNLPPYHEAALVKEIKAVSPKTCQWRI
jgi:hypothetical protein